MFMDILFEFIFEFIVEGALELSTSRRVPLPLRILAAVIVIGVFGGAVFFIALTGVILLRSEDNMIALAVLMFLIAALIAGALIWKVVKYYKNRSKDYLEK